MACPSYGMQRKAVKQYNTRGEERGGAQMDIRNWTDSMSGIEGLRPYQNERNSIHQTTKRNTARGMSNTVVT